ncbi:MAG: hypothetical protein EXS39_04145 [Opitutaceae bacterium]|nr:hypothetical protein [Opitutaceae bacterium]
MNLNHPKHPWSRLVASARQAGDRRDIAAPYGFATRVAARAMASEFAEKSLLARLSLRAFGVACLLMLTTLAVNYTAVSGVFDEVVITPDDPVAALVDIPS